MNPYISRRQRLRVDPDYQVPYAHPSLEEPLRETLGTIIFQDQVIAVCRQPRIATASTTPMIVRARRRSRLRRAARS